MSMAVDCSIFKGGRCDLYNCVYCYTCMQIATNCVLFRCPVTVTVTTLLVSSSLFAPHSVFAFLGKTSRK